jgi:hypothetical protein
VTSAKGPSLFEKQELFHRSNAGSNFPNFARPTFGHGVLRKSRMHNIRPFKLNFREFFAAFESDSRLLALSIAWQGGAGESQAWFFSNLTFTPFYRPRYFANWDF